MNYDHCSQCGEYLNDEMGHVCPSRINYGGYQHQPCECHECTQARRHPMERALSQRRPNELTARDRYILDQLYEHGSTLQIQNGETIGIPLRKPQDQ